MMLLKMCFIFFNCIHLSEIIIFHEKLVNFLGIFKFPVQCALGPIFHEKILLRVSACYGIICWWKIKCNNTFFYEFNRIFLQLRDIWEKWLCNPDKYANMALVPIRFYHNSYFIHENFAISHFLHEKFIESNKLYMNLHEIWKSFPMVISEWKNFHSMKR